MTLRRWGRLAAIGALSFAALSADAAPQSSARAPEGALPASPPTASPVPWPASEVARAEGQWRRLLELERKKGAEKDRLEVESLGQTPASPWVAALADAILDEWRINRDDSRIRNPRKIWSPDAPPILSAAAGGQKLRRRVSGTADVSPEGRVTSVRIEEGSGDDQLDFLVERWARDSRYRPGIEGFMYVSSRVKWSVALRSAFSSTPGPRGESSTGKSRESSSRQRRGRSRE